MQPSRVVMETPLLDDHLGFPEAVEDLDQPPLGGLVRMLVQ